MVNEDVDRIVGNFPYCATPGEEAQLRSEIFDLCRVLVAEERCNARQRCINALLEL